jgi:hypothetical protein
MSIGTIWNHRDFIKREYGEEDAVEFDQIVKNYQAEQIAIERERIIKQLKANEYIWRERVVLNGLIALIKGETNE